jgi:hypothetical protein
MLVRDITGRLHIVSRKDCKNDADYYQKLVKIRSEYIQHYKSVIHICQSQYKPNDNDLLKAK